MMDVNLSNIARESALKAYSEEQSLLLAQITRLETDNANLRVVLRTVLNCYHAEAANLQAEMEQLRAAIETVRAMLR